MSDVHSDWRDYGRSNYTVCGRVDGVTESETTTVGQMENSFLAETNAAAERETTTKTLLKVETRSYVCKSQSSGLNPP